MKRHLFLLILPFFILSLAGSAQAEKDDIGIKAGNLNYVFGLKNGLIRIEDLSGNMVYDFGERPCWFMLTYMFQYGSIQNPRTEAAYFYPQVSDSAPYNFQCPDNGRTVVDDDVSHVHHVTYDYYYRDQEQIKIHAHLLFNIKKTGPFTGVAVYISVDNFIEDGYFAGKVTSLSRLMEVHCPFVRLPKIGNYRSDDVLTMGNYLVKNPIEHLKNTIEPWNVKGDENPTYVNDRGKKYPRDFPVYAYYETVENPGRGLYFALYNTDRKVCKTGIFKHMGSNFWDEIGYTANQPQGSYRDYILWDVVKYPEGVDECENDYIEVSVPAYDDKNLCAFIACYDGNSQDLDWYKAAQKYREDMMAIDEACPTGNCTGDFSYFNQRDVNDLWPDYKIKDNPNIEDWVKYHPLMLYVTGQAEPSLEYMYTTNPTPVPNYDESNSYVLDRIRQYQERFSDYLEVQTGQNNLLVSTWIYEWAQDEDERNQEIPRNHPDWTWGLMPIDKTPPSPFNGEDWKNLFIRDGFEDFLEQLHAPSPSVAKFIAHEGSYYFDSPLNECRLLSGNRKWDAQHKREYLNQSWAYNDIERPALHDKIYGKELRYLWGSEYPSGTAGWGVPYRETAVWQIFPGDKDGMDFLCGDAVKNYGLRAGVLDSLIWSASNNRFLNADGLYSGKTGSDTFHPVYNGLPCLGVHTEYLTDVDGNRIKPGGGNQMYKAYAHIFETLEELPGKRMVMTENFGECFLKYYDMARIDSWPALDCVDTESRGMFTYATDLKVELEEKSSYLPVEFIPFIQAVAHEYLIMQDGTNAFPPGQFWHMNWVVYIDDVGNKFKGIEWPYYGGNTENLEDKWLAYNADLAYSFCYGNRMFLFDVDVPTDEDGIPTDTDLDYVLNLLDEGEAIDSVDLLENSLNHYTALGWPEKKDKPAEALFFGKLLPEPGFDNMMPSVDCQYDLTAGMMGPDVQLNVKLRSSWILHSLWKATMPLSSGDAERLVLVFSNFTPKTYTVTTNPIDITEYLPNASKYYYFKYAIDGKAVYMTKIDDPHHFRIKSTVKSCENSIFGILGKEDYPIPPPSGLYARLNDDDYQDLILLDSGPEKNLAVVLGDGSGSYDEGNAIPILNGVISVDTILNEAKSQDLVCLTETSMKIIHLETAGSPETVMDSGDIFDSASKMKTLVRTKDDFKIIVLDDVDLKTLDISKSVKDSDEDYAFQLKEVECEAVVNFETGWLNDDGFCDIATITTDGSVEILSIHDGDPASQVIIEIGTTATALEIDDSDLDGDADIILEGQGKTKGGVLSNVGGWKFTP